MKGGSYDSCVLMGTTQDPPQGLCAPLPAAHLPTSAPKHVPLTPTLTGPSHLLVQPEGARERPVLDASWQDVGTASGSRTL